MIINVIVLSAQVGLGSVDQVGQHVRCGFCQGGYATPSTLVVLKFVGPHNPRGATSEESPSKSALQVLSYARFLACAVRTEVQHPRRHTPNTHTHAHGSSATLQGGSQLRAHTPLPVGRCGKQSLQTPSALAAQAGFQLPHEYVRK